MSKMMKKGQLTRESCSTPFVKIGSWAYYIFASLFIWHIGAIVITLVQLSWPLLFLNYLCKYTHTRALNKAPIQPYNTYQKRILLTAQNAGASCFIYVSVSLSLSPAPTIAAACVHMALYDFIWNLSVAICSDKKRLRISLTNKWTLHFIRIKCLTAARNRNERTKHKETHWFVEHWQSFQIQSYENCVGIRINESPMCETIFECSRVQYQINELLFIWLVFPHSHLACFSFTLLSNDKTAKFEKANERMKPTQITVRIILMVVVSL